MYRNKEGYASPTEGAAFAHIAHEERMKRKQERAKKEAACKNNDQQTHRADNTQWKLAWTDKNHIQPYRRNDANEKKNSQIRRNP